MRVFSRWTVYSSQSRFGSQHQHCLDSKWQNKDRSWGHAVEHLRPAERDDPVACFRWCTYTFDVIYRGASFVKWRNYRQGAHTVTDTELLIQYCLPGTPTDLQTQTADNERQFQGPKISKSLHQFRCLFLNPGLLLQYCRNKIALRKTFLSVLFSLDDDGG